MYPREEFKKNLIKPSNRAGAMSNGRESGAFCFSTCGCQCRLWLWAGSCCTAPCVQPYSPWCHWLELWQSESTSKSVQASVRCLAAEGTTLNYLHTLLDVKLTAQGKKNPNVLASLWILHREHLLFTELWVEREKKISSPAQMISGFPAALGRMVFVRPSFHLSVHLWTQLTDHQWHGLAAWNPVTLSLTEETPYRTESQKVSLLEIMMMKVQNDLKLNRKQAYVVNEGF